MALAGVAAAETLTFDVERTGNAVTFDLGEAATPAILTLTYNNWTYNGTGGNEVGAFLDPTSTTSNYKNTFSPKGQLQAGTDDSWTMNFTVTNNTGAIVTLTQFTFDAYGLNGDGTDKTAEVPVTLTLGGVSTNIKLAFGGSTTTTGTLALTGDKAITIGANSAVTLSLTMGNAKTHPTYSGIKSGSVSYSIPEPTTATLSLLALAGLAARRRRASR